MSLPRTKGALLKRLRAVYEKLDAEFASVDAGGSQRPGADGLSPCDFLAYVIGWGRLLLGWEEAERAGRTPEMPAPGYRWNQLGPLAASFREEHRKAQPARLLSEFREMAESVASFVEELSPADLFQTGRRRWAGEKWPLVKWIQVNSIAPWTSAQAKIRRWRKQRFSP